MLRFATTNEGKLEEARDHLAGLTDVEQFDYDYLEIQSDDLAAVAARGARESYDALEGAEPVIVDDTGLFIRAFDGFPGPYAAYVEHTLGVERVWEVASDLDDKHAAFRSVVAYADADGVETFEGSVQGTLVAPRGEGGFGYDPIFAYDGTTFAEMSTAEKNAFSHRARALSKLADWLAEQ
jgi:XTP/dITP diphosphohydrolase